MYINKLIQERNISKYRLSKNTGIPYSTISDILNKKVDIRKCSAETIYKLSKELNVTMEDLLKPYMEKRISFELFKSNVCHRLKECGDIDFIIQTLEDDDISKYYDMCWYAESFYLLGMLDYISRVNDVPQCDKYDDIRKYKLDKTIYPLGIQCISKLNDDDTYKQKVLENAIPEFLRFNIVENEVRKVV